MSAKVTVNNDTPRRESHPLIVFAVSKAQQRRRDRDRFIERIIAANQGHYPWRTPRPSTPNGAA